MPSSRSPHAYPVELWDVFKAVGNGKEMHFHFPTLQKARYFTNKANNFRRAVRSTVDHLKPERAAELHTPAELQELKMLRQEVDKVELRQPLLQADGQWLVVAQNRDSSWFAQAVRSGVVMGGPRTAPLSDAEQAAAAASFSRLQGLLGESPVEERPATLSERAKKYLGG